MFQHSVTLEGNLNPQLIKRKMKVAVNSSLNSHICGISECIKNFLTDVTKRQLKEGGFKRVLSVMAGKAQ